MRTKALITALLSLLFIFSTASAATLDNKGTEFWLAFPSNISSPTYLQLYITGDTATSGTVSVSSESFTENFTVTPGSVTTVEVPANTMISSNQTVEDKGIHVTAQDEIIVYGINRVPSTTDAYMGLPVDVLGTEYMVISYTKNTSDSNLTVLGTEDNTSVTISPSAVSGLSSDISITLNQGEIYNLSRTGANEDITGSTLSSDKPIAVFSGSKCINIPQASSACDHIVEQMPPLSTWGKKFVTVPLAARLNGDTFRILASEDNTQVSINDTPAATLSRGEYYEIILETSSYIEADKPVLTAQYSHGINYDSTTGDPFMMLIPPYEQFMNNYTVTTPAEGFDPNYVNIVAQSSAIANITFDDGTVPEGSFTQIGDTDFYGAQVSVELGSHTFSSDKSFGVFSYGFTSADSYGYPGGSSYAPVASFDHVTYTAPASDTYAANSEVCASATAYNSDDETLEGISISFSVSGANTASETVATDSEGVAEFCYTAVNTGTDTITWLDINSGTGSSDVTIGDSTKTVTLSVTNGAFVPASDTISVEAGTELTFTVMPETDYILSTVMLDSTDITQDVIVVSNSDGSYTITYAAGVAADSALSVTFAQDSPAELTAPELISPAAGDTFTTSSTTFTWNEVEGAEKYYITITGHVTITNRELDSEDYSVSDTGVVTWICPVAFSDGEYTWTAAASNTEQTTEYAEANSFTIDRPSSVTDLGDGDDIDFSGTEQVDQLTLNSVASLNASYPIHTESGLSVTKNTSYGVSTVNTIAQVNLGGVIDSTEISEVRVDSNKGTMTFHDADSFPSAVTEDGETVEASRLGLIIQAYDTNSTAANFDVTMLVTQGASSGTIVHTLSTPVSFVLSDLDLIYEAGDTSIKLNGTALTEVAEGETDESNSSGYWYYDSSDETYHVTVRHFSEVTVQNKNSGGGGCSAVKGASAADMGMILIASAALYILTRRRRNA